MRRINLHKSLMVSPLVWSVLDHMTSANTLTLHLLQQLLASTAKVRIVLILMTVPFTFTVVILLGSVTINLVHAQSPPQREQRRKRARNELSNFLINSNVCLFLSNTVGRCCM